MATENDCVVKIADEMSEVEARRWSRQSIYRIPATVTAEKEKFYKPQMVSIGPYHHGAQHLQAMEKHKSRAKRNFLRRLGKRNEFLVRELSPMVQDLKDSYDQLDESMWEGNDAFIDLMIMDGCFVLEILRSASGQTEENSNDGYLENDPIFSKHGSLNIVPYLMRDMLMLENQIPMLVLRVLHCINSSKKCSDELTKLILKFFSQPSCDQNISELSKCLHILDLYRKSLLFDPWKNRKRPKHSTNCTAPRDAIIRSATELRDAGIRIKKSRTSSLQDITFKTVFFGLFGGVLRLPHIVVDDSFVSSYLNLIAYERFHVGAGNDVTSYTFFMDKIIDSVRDVSLLHEGRVIQNALGSDQDMANLFNCLSSDSPLDPNSNLGMVHWRVSSHCQRRVNKWRAYCCHNYFTNPWVAITVVAAMFIFAITIVQTIYSVMSYYNSSST